jgi:DNA-binding winged helix-turn-helix (wHTH) protein
MTTTAQGHVHVSTGTTRDRASPSHAARGRSHGGAAPGGALAPRGLPGWQSVAVETEARGFVVYISMDESAASAAGTSLRRLATELRHYVESVVSGSQCAAAVAIAPAGAPGSGLEDVRQVFGDPTLPPGPRPDLLRVLTRVSTGQPGVVIDPDRQDVRLDGEGLNLALKEFEILHYLVEHHDRAVGREELLDCLWRKTDQIPGERTIDVHIRRLRTKLGRFSSTVRTVRGQGYRFHEHPEVTAWAPESATP